MAFSATTQWDVRTTGSDSNGGGFDTAATGTNRAQADSAFIAFTDLVIDGTTNTKCTSAAHPFDSTSPGNVINITGGTGFSVQRVQVVSVSGVTATCDKSLGTLSSTGGTGNLGGGLLTIGTANGLAIASNTVNIKAGTQTQTVAIAIPTASSTITWMGYGTTWADGGTKPLITTATNSIHLITTSSNAGGVQAFINLSLSNTAGTKLNGIQQLTNHGGGSQGWLFRDCILDGFFDGINSDNSGAHFDLGNVAVVSTEIKNCTNSGIAAGSNSRLWVVGSYIHSNASRGITVNATIVNLDHTIIAANTSNGIECSGGSNLQCTNCTFSANLHAISTGNTSGSTNLYNNIFYGQTATAIAFTSMAGGQIMSRNNAFGNNTGGSGWSPASFGDVTLTATPFTNSGSGDYSLNSTAGGGAACKGAGYPGAFAGGTSTGTLDIGAVQSGGGGGVTAHPFVNPGMNGGMNG